MSCCAQKSIPHSGGWAARQGLRAMSRPGRREIPTSRRYDSRMTWITAVLIVAVALLGLAIWSIKRHKDPHLHLESREKIEDLIPSLSGMSLGTALGGNAAQIFQDAAFYDALLQDIRGARRSVHFETFLWKEGRLGARMAEAFAQKAREGVKVRLVLDAVGCKKIGEPAKALMTAAGCELAFYHPRTLKNIGVIAERDHRKLAILDGRVAWVGGHCIVDEWLDHVRDLSVRLRGPIVHAVQSAFSENWVEVTGKLFVGHDLARGVKPEGSAPAVKILHHTAICCARERLWVQNPYFIPEPDAVGAFAEAVKRGVDVRIMVPSAEASDMALVQHAAHRNFQRLLDCGVRLFEYQKSLLHQKVMTVDGVWCAIGSSNFDDRSFETNDEITVGFHDPALARRLEEIFEADLPACIELDAAKWKKRGLLHRAKDSALYLFNEVL
jgi:cardiolipin synthase A/B